MSEYLGKGEKEDSQDTEESLKSPSKEVEDVFLSIFMVEEEIGVIDKEIQKQSKGINVQLEEELNKLYSLLDELYEALPLTGEQDKEHEEEKDGPLYLWDSRW